MFDNIGDTPKKKIRVALYLRVSTDEQVVWNGLDVQEKALRDFVKNNSDEYTLSQKNIYIDEWKSWAKKEKDSRPALYKMYCDAKNGDFDVLLVWKIDRFFRKTLYLLEGVEALDNLWVKFKSITQNFDTSNAFWKMMLQMMWVIAELERDLIRERTQAGVIASMRKWKWWRWKPPYGYRANSEKYLEIYEPEAVNVRMAFEMLVTQELTLNELTHKFNDASINTASYTWSLWKQRKKSLKHQNFWSAWVLHRMMKNTIYIWEMVQNKNMVDKISSKRIVERPKEDWIIWKSPAIISSSLFHQAQHQLHKNLRFQKRNNVKQTYMLSTLLQDKETGRKYCWYMSWKKTKNYRLNNDRAKNKEYIKPRWISWSIIESAVWSKMTAIINNPDMLLEELIYISQDKDEEYTKYQMQNLEKKIQDLQNNTRYLLQLESEISKWDMDIAKEKIRDNREQIDKLEVQLDNFKATIIPAKEKKQQLRDLKKMTQEIHKYICSDDLDYEAKTQICRLLIDKVCISGDDIEIYMFVPKNKPRGRPKDKKTRIVETMFQETTCEISTKMKSAYKKLKGFTLEFSQYIEYGTPDRIRTYNQWLRRKSKVYFRLWKKWFFFIIEWKVL